MKVRLEIVFMFHFIQNPEHVHIIIHFKEMENGNKIEVWGGVRVLVIPDQDSIEMLPSL